MSRLQNLFQEKTAPILNIYFTAGYPYLDATLPILEALQEAGTDMVEIGMPYSDPLADGPTIQDSSLKALQNGMNLSTLFQQLKDCRQTINLPIVLMGYLNPVLQFGVENFLKACQEVGVDGLILPDLPLDEYEETYKALFEQYDIDNIMLVTPETVTERLHRIDQTGSGFIYAVSSSSTTGSTKNWEAQTSYFKRLADENLQLPILTGFGVSDYDSFKAASAHTNGAIIGTAFVKSLATQNEKIDKKSIAKFINNIKSPSN